ncbi:MAG: HAD hydrolase-like protein [Actinobacteria bacterium]|nr:HAD hydrolase-like protein [Actinomycetota bacterium]
MTAEVIETESPSQPKDLAGPKPRYLISAPLLDASSGRARLLDATRASRASAGRPKSEPLHLGRETFISSLFRPDFAYILVGDSVSDITAARQAGIRSIGYANAIGKRRALSEVGADIIIDDMAALGQAAIAST